MLDSADVLIWGTEKDADQAGAGEGPAVQHPDRGTERPSIYTGGELAAAIYFTTPLSLPYVLDNLVPKLAEVL